MTSGPAWHSRLSANADFRWHEAAARPESVAALAGATRTVLPGLEARQGLRGHPPKFVFLRVGNCSTSRVAEVLLANAELLADFAASDGESVLILE